MRFAHTSRIDIISHSICGIQSAQPPSVHALAAIIEPGAHRTDDGTPACLDCHVVTFEPLRTDHTCTRESAPPDNTYRPSGVQHASKSSASRPPPPRFPPLPPVSVATSMRLTSSNGAKAL